MQTKEEKARDAWIEMLGALAKATEALNEVSHIAAKIAAIDIACKTDERACELLSRASSYLESLNVDSIGFPSVFAFGKQHGLTEHESAAVYGWTTGDFFFVNPIARGQDEVEYYSRARESNTLRKLAREKVLPYIQILSLALSKLPPCSITQRLYRGHRRAVDAEIGRVVSMSGFFSATYDMDISLGFVTQSNLGRFSRRTLIVIESSFSGRIVSRMSARKFESEVLFPMDTYFEIVPGPPDVGKDESIVQEATEKLRKELPDAEIDIVYLREVANPDDDSQVLIL